MTDVKIQPPMLVVNIGMFTLIFHGKKFLEAARVVVDFETTQADGKWHPVGKHLACQSIELSLKAFLRLKGLQQSKVERLGHRIAELLAEARKLNLKEFVKLTRDEISEIKKASNYFQNHVFRYPKVAEMAVGYPSDPDVVPLLSAAGKLVEGLYYKCRAAA